MLLYHFEHDNVIEKYVTFESIMFGNKYDRTKGNFIKVRIILP